jgi:hypothetical protein
MFRHSSHASRAETERLESLLTYSEQQRLELALKLLMEPVAMDNDPDPNGRAVEEREITHC